MLTIHADEVSAWFVLFFLVVGISRTIYWAIERFGGVDKMSDEAINIRILFWHWHVTLDGRHTFSLNRHRIKKQQWRSLVFPFAVYDFKLWRIK